MAVIIISSNSLPKAAQIAAETAKALNYRCLGREILRVVGEKYGVSEEKLHKTLDELPSLLGVSAKAHALYLAYIEEAVLARVSQDRVVCHGLAAHLYVRGVSHAFKVRVLADPSELIRAMVRERGVSAEKAAKDTKHEEALRRRWSLDHYRVDETAPSLYDLVIDLSRMVPEEARMTPEEAVKMIIESSSHPKFKPMTYSVKSVKDMELASRVRVALVDHFPDVIVEADGVTVVVKTAAVPREKGKKVEAIEKLVRGIPGVGHVEVHVANDIIRQAAESFR
jgi:cytidylate kinase